MPKLSRVEKPPYQIPSMEEIRAAKPNGLTVVSTFSGGGGSCLGFKWAGYRHLLASEFVPAARAVYEANFPGVVIDPRDIREMSVKDVLAKIGLDPGELDVLEGSPPCANFSTAGKRHKSWGQVKKYSDTEQRSDDLFFEFARLLDGLKPAAFVAENVSGMVKGVAKGYFKLIFQRLQDCGYRVQCRILDAQWLGVPQARQRAIFVGVREDLGVDPVHPSPLPYRYAIRDAIPYVDGVRYDPRGQFTPKDFNVGNEPISTITIGAQGSASGHFKVTKTAPYPASSRITKTSFRGAANVVDPSLPAPTIMAGGIGGVGVHQIGIAAPLGVGEAPMLEGTAIGEEWKKMRPGEQSDRYFNLVRPDPDRPLPTVTQIGGQRGVASVTHPSEPRKFTIPELRRLCGFPDDYVLTGSYAQQWERLGRAVPPPMMYHVAKALADQVLLPWKERSRVRNPRRSRRA